MPIQNNTDVRPWLHALLRAGCSGPLFLTCAVLLLLVVQPVPPGIAAQGLPSQDRGILWSGSLSMDVFYRYPDIASLGSATSWEDVTRVLTGGAYGGLSTLSLTFQGGDPESVRLVGLFKLGVPYGMIADILAASQAVQMPQTAGTVPWSPLLLEVSKLYATISFPAADLSLGRMIVNYGKGRLFSPSDLFSAVNLADLALGRTGTDVARLQVPLSDLAGLDLVSSLAVAPDRAVFGGRTFAAIGGWDLSAVLFQNGGGLGALQSGGATLSSEAGQPAILAGIDFKGDMVLGVYGELLSILPWEAGTLLFDQAGLSVMLGADYSLGGKLLFTLEYLGNFGPGSHPGQFQAGTNLFGSLAWNLDQWTSLGSHGIYVVDTRAWQATVSLTRQLLRRTSLMVYSTASCGDVRSETATSAIPGGSGLDTSVLILGVTVKAAF
ncbi:MAG: hypothetical protein SNJ56_01935 [Termitinemataceae bacterium]